MRITLYGALAYNMSHGIEFRVIIHRNYKQFLHTPTHIVQILTTFFSLSVHIDVGLTHILHVYADFWLHVLPSCIRFIVIWIKLTGVNQLSFELQFFLLFFLSFCLYSFSIVSIFVFLVLHELVFLCVYLLKVMFIRIHPTATKLN